MTDATANRAAMPTVAKLVDWVRSFDPEARVVYASENGHTIGKPAPPGAQISDSDLRDIVWMRAHAERKR